MPEFVRVVDGHPLTEAHFEHTVKHPVSVMFWSCFSYYGVGRVHVIEGTLNTDGYLSEIINGRLLQQMTEWYPQGNGIFQQDNAPCHVSKKAMKHFAEKKIQLLDWPPSSPDLNPIENFWAIVKRRIRMKGAHSRQTIIQEFIRIWYHDEDLLDICRSLVDSMSDRVQAVISAKGGHSSY